MLIPIKLFFNFILSLPRGYKRLIVILFDLLTSVFTVWLSFGLRLEQWSVWQTSHWIVLFAVVIFSLPIYIRFGIYRSIFRYIGTAVFSTIMHAFAFYTFIFFTIFFLIGVGEVPRSIGIIQPIILFLLIALSRYSLHLFIQLFDDPFYLRNKTKRQVLIYGAGFLGRQLAAGLVFDSSIKVIGFVDDDKGLHGNAINGILVYSEHELEDIIKKNNISDIFLALPFENQSRRKLIIDNLFKYKIRVQTLPNYFNLSNPKIDKSVLSDLDINDILGRETVPPDANLLEKNILGKTVLVTGAGGSIGSEICRQIIKHSPKFLILIDSNEYSLYRISEEISAALTNEKNFSIENYRNHLREGANKSATIEIKSYLVSVRDRDVIFDIFQENKPHTVFHAAAYKHVSLVENNIVEGIRNNVIGTLNCAQASIKVGVSSFTLVSTDKAVRPTNVMGASKRIAELILQALSNITVLSNNSTIFSMVRFGNVLGSSGSVAPLFAKQIKLGGPVTLTHPEVTRFFMTIPEAAQLVIQSSSMATGGDVFILDMGKPIRIYDLAIRMIYLSGFLLKDDQNPNGDVEIKITGLRAGEKLHEELLLGNNPQITNHPKIMKANEEFLHWNELEKALERLNLVMKKGNTEAIKMILKDLVPHYQPYVNK